MQFPLDNYSLFITGIRLQVWPWFLHWGGLHLVFPRKITWLINEWSSLLRKGHRAHRVVLGSQSCLAKTAFNCHSYKHWKLQFLWKLMFNDKRGTWKSSSGSNKYSTKASFPPLWFLLLFQKDPLTPGDLAPSPHPRRLLLPDFAVFGWLGDSDFDPVCWPFYYGFRLDHLMNFLGVDMLPPTAHPQ